MRPSLLAGILGAGGATAVPLQYATDFNKFPASLTTHNTTLLKGFSIHEVFIGSGDLTSIAAKFDNAVADAGSGLVSNSNAVTIESVALESRNSSTTDQSVPMPFPGGSRSYVMSAGERTVLTQEILPSAFGLTVFTQGDRYMIKVMWAVATAGHTVATSRRYNEPDGYLKGGTVRFRGWCYDPAATTPASIDSVNVWGSVPNVTGTAATTLNVTQRTLVPAMVGRFATTKKVALIVGDSIQDVNAGFMRAALMYSANGVQANGEVSLSGAKHSDMAWLDAGVCGYANILMEGLGINFTTSFTTPVAVWDAARAAGITKILKSKITPSCTSASKSTTSVDYAWNGSATIITVNTAATLPIVGHVVTVAGATPSGINGGSKTVLTSGSGAFTYSVTSNLGTGTATGTITWSNQWTIEADQATSDANQAAFNAWLVTKEADSTIDELVPCDEVRSLTNPLLFREVSGASYCNDPWATGATVGKHPTPAVQLLIGAAIAPVYDAMTP